jgi:hypothetical protein
VRRAGLVAAGVVAVVAVTQSGLLSGDGNTPRPKAPTPSATTERVSLVGPRPVVRVGDQLHTVTRNRLQPGPVLPAGFGRREPLVLVPRADGTGPLVGVHDGELFRADPGRDTWRSLGHAEAVVSAAPGTSRALVVRDDEVVTVEVATGSTVDENPFPGFDGDQGWRPLGVLESVGVGALVLSRPVQGGADELALAWPARRVRDGDRPELQRLGRHGPLLGIADDWLLTLSACSGGNCAIEVLSTTRDAVNDRLVRAPPGWSFVAGSVAGRSTEALVPVDRDGVRALARLVPGGDNALLVQGTEGVHLAAGLATGPDGGVYLLAPNAVGDELAVRVWDSRFSSRAWRVHSPTVPTTATLVCACG